jgi:predicted cupin superfamily sugar epimerase
VTIEVAGNAARPGEAARLVLGVDVASGEQPQVLVPAGVWQRTASVDHDALVSCLVSPGFDFADFELLA